MSPTEERELAAFKAAVYAGSNYKKYGASPLCFAAETGNDSMVRLLLEAGEDVNQSSNDGTTPLMTACFLSTAPAVVKILLAHRANVNATNDRATTALLLASQKGNAAIVRLLLEAGAKVNVKSASGNTPIGLATAAGHAEIAALLRTADSSPRTGLKKSWLLRLLGK